MTDIPKYVLDAARVSAWNGGEWIEGEMEEVAMSFGYTIDQIVSALERLEND